MPQRESLIWSALLGALLTVMAFTAARVAMAPRSRATWRGLTYVLLISAVLAIHSNFAHALWHLPSSRRWQGWLQIFVGPLAAGVTLFYLGKWMGALRSDRLLRYATQRGGLLLCLCAAVLALAGLGQTQATLEQWLLPVAALALAGALLGVIACVRAIVLGDRLARWMAVACSVLTLMTVSMYAYSLGLLGAGTLLACVTSVTALVFFVMATMLVEERNRDTRRLARLAGANFSVEPATGLSMGASFVSQVEHEFWRMRRRRGQCAVLCAYLHNLHEVGRTMDATSEYQVLVAMAARVSRAAGVRATVGLYHPQCFVVVMHVDRDRGLPDLVRQRLHALACEPMQVQQADGGTRSFTPRVSLAMTTTDASRQNALQVLNAAEAEAQRASPLVPQSEIDTVPGVLAD